MVLARTWCLAVLIGLAAAAPAAAAVRAREDTHPRMHPTHGTRRTSFSVTVGLRVGAGHSGSMRIEYGVAVVQPGASRTACAAPSPPPITEGAAGTRVRVALAPPRHGWCVGRYRVAVFRLGGPYCPSPAPGQPVPPCPAFLSRTVAAGVSTFSVAHP